jgi:hypothetical protein
MNNTITIWGIVTLIWLVSLYKIVGITKIVNVLNGFKTKEYWNPLYNRIEAISWISKIGIIVPGLVFGKEIWWLHTITLISSSLLIWVKAEKGLPTLIVFNTIWIGISSWVLIKNLLMIIG